MPKTTIASAKTSPPIPTMATATTTHGIATTTRAVVSDISGTNRCQRERSGSTAGAGGAAAPPQRQGRGARLVLLAEVEQVVRVGQEALLGSSISSALLAIPPELERRRIDVLDHRL